jgi:serine/threonine protein kinase
MNHSRLLSILLLIVVYKGVSFKHDNSEYRINCMEDLICDKKDYILGSGHSGYVFEMTHIESGQKFAVKIIENQDIDNLQFNELDISNYDLNSCPSIIKFYGYLSENNKYYLFYELMDIDLNKFIEKAHLIFNNNIPEILVSKVAKCVLEAIGHLADKKLMHQDIKPSNIVLNKHGQIKLIDFGDCSQMDENNTINNDKGDEFYKSPEKMLTSQPYTIKSDIWSLGMTLLEMITGKYPFEKDSPWSITNAIKDNSIPYLKTAQYSLEMCEFVNSCLSIDANKRSCLNQLLQHDFIQKYLNTNIDCDYLRKLILK